MKKGYLLTAWNSSQRILQVALDHPGGMELKEYPEAPGTPPVKQFSCYTVATKQQHSRIGLGVNWCVAKFFIDDLTYSNVVADPNFPILFTFGNQDEVFNIGNLNEIRSFLQAQGLTAQDISREGFDDISLTRKEMKELIREYAKQL